MVAGAAGLFEFWKTLDYNSFLLGIIFGIIIDRIITEVGNRYYIYYHGDALDRAFAEVTGRPRGYLTRGPLQGRFPRQHVD